MNPKNSHSIITTYRDKYGHLATVSTGVRGGTDKEAMIHYRDIVRARSERPDVLDVVLVDAGENVLAQWTRPVERMVAA